MELLHGDVRLLDDEWGVPLGAEDAPTGELDESDLMESFRVEEPDVDAFESTLYDATITLENPVRSLELERSESNLDPLLTATTAVSTMRVAATNLESEVTTVTSAAWLGGRPMRAASTVGNWITGRLLPAIKRLSNELWSPA